MDANRQELEREKEKWESFKKTEEKKIRSQAESAADSKLAAFKDKLKAEEEREVREVKLNMETQLRNYERDMEQRVEAEKIQVA